ncbi:MAG: ATP-binding cassette domain-containing protein [Saprospiraceae bacterium]
MFQLNNVQPEPIPSVLMEQSNIWATKLNIEKGKRYLVTAASGKGKSTFLHAMYGLRKDYSGQVTFDNQDVKQFGLDNWATIRQEHVAIVFQDLRLFLNLSGLENIRLKSELTNIKSTEQIKAMAKRLGVESILGQTCGTMSYGQRQRIAIIRALCQPFDILFLDEPFSHLDEANIKVACALIEEVCEEQKSGFVLVSLGENYFLDYDETLIL